MDAKKLARMFKALSVETRVHIVQLLKQGPLCVGALSAQLGITQGAVSQHLRVLRGADLVLDDKRGCFVHYSINDETLAQWKGALDSFMEADNPKCECSNQNKGEMQCRKTVMDVDADARSQKN